MKRKVKRYKNKAVLPNFVYYAARVAKYDLPQELGAWTIEECGLKFKFDNNPKYL